MFASKYWLPEVCKIHHNTFCLILCTFLFFFFCFALLWTEKVYWRNEELPQVSTSPDEKMVSILNKKVSAPLSLYYIHWLAKKPSNLIPLALNIVFASFNILKYPSHLFITYLYYSVLIYILLFALLKRHTFICLIYLFNRFACGDHLSYSLFPTYIIYWKRIPHAFTKWIVPIPILFCSKGREGSGKSQGIMLVKLETSYAFIISLVSY